MDALDGTYADARVERNRLPLVRSGLASPEEVQALQTAKSDFTAAEAARQAHLDALFAAATGGSTGEVITRLQHLRANDTWKLPKQYGLVERTEQAWVDLRDALANEKISAKYEEDPDPESQALLATLNADTEVATAKASLDTNSSAVEAAWCQALAAE